MTPGSGGLDMLSPIGVIVDNSVLQVGIQKVLGSCLISWSIARKSNDDTVIGVVHEVLADGSCSVALGSSGNGDTIIAHPTEIEIVVPKKSDKPRSWVVPNGATVSLLGVDGTDGIVKVDDTLDVKILDMVILAKLAHA
ncbi:hypothetical protein HAX54_046419 [Datura stramonium]|uniref:Uncharacterized protein n=1 Tax=Datura stramonium TaxID=4076 RepID=A0ABS8SRW2_DATST|nr:hypothetical protein [Datura stramonium]